MEAVFLVGELPRQRQRGCVCSLPLMFPVRFGLFYLQVCLFHYFSKPADFLMELLIFFLAAAPPGEARQRTNGVHCELRPGAALLLLGPRGIEGFHCTGQVSSFSQPSSFRHTQTEELRQLTGARATWGCCLKQEQQLPWKSSHASPGSGKGEQVQRCTPKMKPAPLSLFCSQTSWAEAWCFLLLNTSDLARPAGRFL